MKDPKHTGPSLYSIGMVKEATGLSERRIRYYESQHLIQPRRTAGNQRLYTEHDIEVLRQVKSLLEQGLSLKGVREKLVRQAPSDLAPHHEVERDADTYFEARRIARGLPSPVRTLSSSIHRMRMLYGDGEHPEELNASSHSLPKAKEVVSVRPTTRRRTMSPIHDEDEDDDKRGTAGNPDRSRKDR